MYTHPLTREATAQLQCFSLLDAIQEEGTIESIVCPFSKKQATTVWQCSALSFILIGGESV